MKMSLDWDMNTDFVTSLSGGSSRSLAAMALELVTRLLELVLLVRPTMMQALVAAIFFMKVWAIFKICMILQMTETGTFLYEV